MFYGINTVRYPREINCIKVKLQMSTCTAELRRMIGELETVWLSELLEEAIVIKAGRGNLGRNRL
jgi:hypothetical protein